MTCYGISFEVYESIFIMDHLPIEIIREIYLYLNRSSLIALSNSSRRMYAVADTLLREEECWDCRNYIAVMSTEEVHYIVYKPCTCAI